MTSRLLLMSSATPQTALASSATSSASTLVAITLLGAIAFKVFYDLPKGGQSSGGIESLDGGAAARLLLDLQHQAADMDAAAQPPLLCDS